MDRSHPKSPRHKRAKLKTGNLDSSMPESRGDGKRFRPYNSPRTSPKKCRPIWIPTGALFANGIVGLHQEIEHFYQWIKTSDPEFRMRDDIVQEITRIIKRRYPHAVIECFGSYATNLMLPQSDIDLVITGKWWQLPFHTLMEDLVSAGFCDREECKILDRATVPILKVTNRRTQVKVDISFNMVNGVNGARWINEKISKHSCLPKLVMVLKMFLQVRDLNEVFTGGISSYSLILMVVSFLELHPRYQPGSPSTNLGVLLLEFLEFYGRNFNHKKVGIRMAGEPMYVSKTVFNNIADPNNQTNGSGRPGLLSIEDPLRPGHDIAKSSYGFVDVRSAFDYAFSVLTRLVTSDEPKTMGLLSAILSVPQEVVHHRRMVEAEYSKR